jgi:anti-sigma regulatory factor (Ser/Thr protein kinase)
VRRHLREHALSRLSDDLELVVSELSTNAMVHAATSFKVSLYAFEQTLLLEVEDGSRDGPSLVAREVLDPNGRGLAIVNLLSRHWGVDPHRDGGKSVWAEFSLL